LNKRYVIFISSDAWYSEVIKFVESIGDESKGFVPSHCGMDVSGHFREALSSGFVETNINLYDKNKVRIFELDVPDEFIQAGDTEFNKVWGRPYGWLALLNGAIYTLTGIETEGDGEFTGDCSEDDTRILRAYGYDILDSVPADCITPYILYKEVEKIGKLVENV